MRKLLVIASREYSAAVKTKAFLIGLLIMPIMMGGSILIEWFVKDVRDVKDEVKGPREGPPPANE